MFKLFVIALVGVTLVGCGVDKSDDSYLTNGKYENSRRFMATVLLGSEYGDSGSITRFVRSPRLSVFGGDPYKDGLVRTAAAQINQAIATSRLQIQIAAANDRSADILVYYAPMSSFAQIARDHGFQYYPGNSGFFWIFSNGANEITRSVVMIATDVLSNQELASVTVEEITQSMGAVNDQDEIQESIFFESRYDSGYASQLSDLDRRLLRFLYGTLRPGQRIAQADYLFNRYWVE